MKLENFILPLLSLTIAALAAIGIVLFAGESLSVLTEALHNTVGTSYGLGYTLFYTTPHIFTGLAVAVAFHCGLFNIGAEGQLYMGSLAVVIVAALFPAMSPWLGLPLVMVAIFLIAGGFAGIAGFLRAFRGSHEVIVTILLNFIAYAIVDYFILHVFHDPNSPNPETFTMGDGYRLSLLSDWAKRFGLTWFDTTPVNSSLGVALAACAVVYVLLFHTTWGFELRTVGRNPLAARYAGISVSRNMVLAFVLSGGLAGMVGLNEVMGNQYRLTQGFSPMYGFTGIAVAMLARNHPIGIIFSAFLFGFFHCASREIEFASDKISKEMSSVLQAVLISVVASEYLWAKWLRKARKPKPVTHA